MNEIESKASCSQVREHLEGLVDGELDESLERALSAHLEACDECRDLRHEAERAVAKVRELGSDYVHPADFLDRLLRRLDEAGSETSRSEVDGAGAAAEPAAAEPAAAEPAAATPPAATPPAATPPAAEQPAVTRPEVEKPAVTRPEAENPAAARPATEAPGGSDLPEPKPSPKRFAVLELLGRRGGRPLVGAALAAAAVLFLWWSEGRDRAEPGPKLATRETSVPWAGRILEVVRGFGSQNGLEVCRSDGSGCSSVTTGGRIEPGSKLVTDGLTRARIELDDGTEIALDRMSELRFDGERQRRAALERGDAIFDVRRGLEELAVVDVPAGRVEVLGTKFAVQVEGDSTRVDVSRGEVRLVDAADRDVAVFAGQSGRLSPDAAPLVMALPDLGESFSWGEHAFFEEEVEAPSPRGLGELRAKKPGETEERTGAVTLTRHAVKVRIQEAMARTEVEEVFTNHTDERLEGIFRFPLPPDAQIERLALEVDGRWEEGAFVDRERALAIWRGAIVNSGGRRKPVREEVVWVPGPWKDPALLEWQSGGRFELRIFPIEKRSTRRVRLTYTQKLSPHGDRIAYAYPLAHDPSGSTRVAEFQFDADVMGHDGQVWTRGYDFDVPEAAPSGRTAHRGFRRADFVPTGDIGLEFRLGGEQREVRAFAYDAKDSGGGRYVALSFRPRLPLATQRADRAYVFVVDRSRSMYGEQFDRARAVVVRALRELDRGALVAVLDCDTECSRFASDFRAASDELSRDVDAYLGRVRPEGASDLVASLSTGIEMSRRADGREVEVVYVGDGASTVGEVLPSFVGDAVRRALRSNVRVSAVTVGTAADPGALAAATRAGGGVVIPFVPGQGVGEAAFALLGATYGGALSQVKVALPEGLSDLAPSEPGTLLAGQELVVVARMSRAHVAGEARLSGQLGDEPFEVGYELSLEATTEPGNAFVPRLFAATRIADLENDSSPGARERAVELSQRFNVASRHTSLLVLESPAMFRAFGLDNQRTSPLWTGHEEAVSSDAGELLDADDAFGPSAGNELGRASGSTEGSGFGAGSGRQRRDAASKARRPSFAPPPQAAAPAPERKKTEDGWPGAVDSEAPPQLRPPPRDEFLPPRPMVPMRKVWERFGTIRTDGVAITSEELERRRSRFESNPLSRDALRSLYSGYLLAGEFERAEELAERWSEKDPLDPEALTARADLAAQRGDRAFALRILGSVIDVRPGDHQAHFRLARALRWSSREPAGCRHAFADAQRRTNEPKALEPAVRCLRELGQGEVAARLLAAAPSATRQQAEQLLARSSPASDRVTGDFQVKGSWDGGTDLDLVILHPEGYRVSWLGAPTRAVISARDVLGTSGESLALSGAASGTYAIEVTRADGQDGAVVRGSVEIRIGDQTRHVPFSLDGTRTRLATVRVSSRSRLVPVDGPPF